MSALDTIVAPATAHGVGSVAIVRLSGKNALKIAQKLLISQIRNLNQSEQNQSFSDRQISLNSTNSCDIKKIDTNINENYSQNSSNLISNPDAQDDTNLAQISYQNSSNHSQILRPRYAHFKQIFIDGKFIDEAIVIYFKAPHSFTGEDIVEFQLHGGFIIANLVMDALVSHGARLAMPGEFSKRAFLNDKMDLAKANAISNLILSRCADSAKILARTISGELGSFLDSLRTELVRTLAFCETSIDYAEEDLPRDILEQISKMLKENSEKLAKIVEISRYRRGLIDGFKIAIIGKPNVGKSSILNALLNENRAIISDVAGTTRDTIEENLRLGTHLVRIIDTAGIRESKDKIEKIGIENSFRAVEKADIVLAIFDASKPSDSDDEKIMQICKNCDKKLFFVLNKCDLGIKNDLKFDKIECKNTARANPNLFANHHKKDNANLNLEENVQNLCAKPIEISAKSSVSPIIDALENYLNSQNYDGLMLSAEHEIRSCKIAQNALERAVNLLSESELELFAYELNEAIEGISKITRKFDRDEILDEMFSHFCLGK